MDDLISRKSLINNLNKFAPEHYTRLIDMLIEKEPRVDAVLRGAYEQCAWECKVAMEQLEEHGIPFGCIADVRAIRHGFWIHKHNGTFQCSVCGKDASKMKFCGNCGAKMDGKV